MLRPATDADQPDVLAWRNHPDVRAVSLTQHVIGEDEHADWWESTKQRQDRLVLMYVKNDRTAGVVTFFDLDREAVKIASNQMRYDMIAQLASSQLAGLSWAVSDGKR